MMHAPSTARWDLDRSTSSPTNPATAPRIRGHRPGCPVVAVDPALGDAARDQHFATRIKGPMNNAVALTAIAAPRNNQPRLIGSSDAARRSPITSSPSGGSCPIDSAANGVSRRRIQPAITAETSAITRNRRSSSSTPGECRIKKAMAECSTTVANRKTTVSAIALPGIETDLAWPSFQETYLPSERAYQYAIDTSVRHTKIRG